MERSCLPKEERLCGAARIRDMFKKGHRYSCDGAKLFVLPNKLPYNRFVCTFKRHYGSAVQRNKARRLSKEVYRQMKSQLAVGADILLLVFPGSDTFSIRARQLYCLFKKADMFSIQSQQYETQLSEKD
ncbi:ribonuclease P protein component [Treponema vincentii F0403]|uniref:Ribonuclease P protein component n=1 Tax=Treponema vincentii F0403 TaxID=1125702 RepID=S3MBS8_9SPIR|nr:ribonuclease P protein component [Treponema vincentii]EPF46484.1 ribonuclease P protein component [Treponema vincentii F0403]UTC47867.1 ribonuclease P protein component [Treponema vincentii]